MHFYYIKKGDLYLHIETVQHEDYQDYSDIYAMNTQQYVFKKEKDGAMTFHDASEARRYIIKKRLKGVEAERG